MSVSTNVAVIAFATAQRKLVKSAESHRAAFTNSAIACALALRERGVTLQRLADANRELTSDIVAAPKGTLMVSPTGVTWHALTGELLMLDFDVDGDDMPEPQDVQAVIAKVYKDARYGVKTVKACIRKATSQQECLAWLREALAVKVEVETVETVETVEAEDTGDTTELSADAKVEAMLSSVLSLVNGGAGLSDTSRAILAQLSGPVAVPVAV